MTLIPQQGNWREREISEAQMKYLDVLQGRLALSRQGILQCATRVCKRFIGNVTDLKSGEASDLIDYLNEQLQP